MPPPGQAGPVTSMPQAAAAAVAAARAGLVASSSAGATSLATTIPNGYWGGLGYPAGAIKDEKGRNNNGKGCVNLDLYASLLSIYSLTLSLCLYFYFSFLDSFKRRI